MVRERSFSTDIAGLVRLWFSLDGPVSRRAYALTGVSLMALKYVVDGTLIFVATDRVLLPLQYLNPVMAVRHESITDVPTWLVWLLLVWTLPFMWIGLSMTVRRAVDAGLSAWAGLLFLIPVVNYVTMIWLALRGPRAGVEWTVPKPEFVADKTLRAALPASAAAVLIGVGMVALTHFVIGTYGASLLFGTHS